MFDLSWGEMGLIAMVALLVIGPKELPQVLRTVRTWLGAARGMAREFQGHVDDMMKDSGITEPAYLNMMLTNGNFFVGTRYTTDPGLEPLTLYHSEGGRYIVEDGISQMVAPKDDDQAVLVVSEKLTEAEHWTAIPANHFVVVDQELNVRVRAIKA